MHISLVAHSAHASFSTCLIFWRCALLFVSLGVFTGLLKLLERCLAPALPWKLLMPVTLPQRAGLGGWVVVGVRYMMQRFPLCFSTCECFVCGLRGRGEVGVADCS